MGQAMYATVTIESGYSGQIAAATLGFVVLKCLKD